METRPFDLGSPERIAKLFGGDKQKIFQALQSGALRQFAPAPMDQTLAAAAADFSDHMRAAAQAEAVPQQTVFEKLFTPPQPQMQPGTPMGLGATPEAAMGMPAPQIPAPQMPMPEMPMPGMAMGGLASLDVPDGMFDEPDDGGYATGGLVAFARGGIADLYDDVEYWESGGNQNAVSPKGARGVMQLMPGTMRDPGFGVTPMRDDSEAENRRVGREYLDAMYRRYGDRRVALAAYNWGPGNVDKWLKSGADPKKLPAETRKYIGNVMSNEGELAPAAQTKGSTLYGFDTDLQGNIDMLTAMAPEEAPEQIEYREDLKRQLSPESRAEAKKDAFYAGLAKFAERLGASQSPTLLGGLAESVGGGASDLAASMKAAEEDAREMQREYVGLANASRKEKMELMRMGVDVTGNMARLAEGIEARREEVAIKREQIALAKRELEAKIDAASKEGVDPEKLAVSYILSYPKNSPQYLAAKEYYEIRYGGSDGRKGKTNTLEERVEAGKGGTPKPPEGYNID